MKYFSVQCPLNANLLQESSIDERGRFEDAVDCLQGSKISLEAFVLLAPVEFPLYV